MSETGPGARVTSVDGRRGVRFAVWAPHARAVSVVGDFNAWDGTRHPMSRDARGILWEAFVPDLGAGALYKFAIETHWGEVILKSDPRGLWMEVPPKTASIVFEPSYAWGDGEWMEARRRSPLDRPLAIYEVHLDSWLGGAREDYRKLGHRLADYVVDLGFTHVELMPVMEHPYGPSWGYQVTGYFAPTSRFGTPDDFRYFVDLLHRRGVGVILDWVPAHFPKDEYALGRFDGTALYEHPDPRRGEHPDWGTYIFDYGRSEVRAFLVANALWWLEEFHADGLRLDAVASMLYLDYSRRPGQWLPNAYGGHENIDAVSFLRELNEITHSKYPGTMIIAEESTAWPGVSRPLYTGGLGFTFKWNMGWMHDTLGYFRADPVFRKYVHDKLTFGLLYAWSENYVLPLSHDEVVHGKGSLLQKMPGPRDAKFANLRSLLAYMWAHPGKKILFMGGEFGQWGEWSHDRGPEWESLDDPLHKGVQNLVRDLNRAYRAEPALWECDFDWRGFRWIDLRDIDGNIVSFLRMAPESGRALACVCNFSGMIRTGYRVGLPKAGKWREVINTDAEAYGGGGAGNLGGVEAEEAPFHDQPCSAPLTLPPMSVVWLEGPPTPGE